MEPLLVQPLLPYRHDDWQVMVPLLVQPPLVQPLLVQPLLAQPSLVQPLLVQYCKDD